MAATTLQAQLESLLPSLGPNRAAKESPMTLSDILRSAAGPDVAAPQIPASVPGVAIPQIPDYTETNNDSAQRIAVASGETSAAPPESSSTSATATATGATPASSGGGASGGGTPGAIDVASLLVQQKIQQGQRDAAQIQMQTAFEQGHTAAANQNAAIQEAGNVSAQIREAAGKLQLEQEYNRLQLANLISSPKKIVELTTRLDDLNKSLDAEAGNLDKRLAVGFYDNPMEWLYNQFYLPAATQQFNAHIDSRDRLTSQISSLQSISSDAVKQVNATALTTSAAIIADQAKGDILKSAVLLGDAKQTQMRDSFAYYKLSSEMADKGLAEKLNIHQAWAAEASLQLARARDARESEQFAIQKPLMQQALNDARDLDARLKIASTRMGLPTPLTSGLYKLMSGPDKDALNGILANTGLAPTPMAATTFEALEVMHKLNAQLATPEARNIAQKLFDVSDTAITKAKLLPGGNDPIVQRKAGNDAIKARVDLDQRNPETAGSIYGPPSVATLDAWLSPVDKASVRQIPLWQKYFGARSAIKGAESLPVKIDDILLAANEEIKKGLSLEAAAAQGASIVNFIMMRNNSVKPYDVLGLPFQQDYKVGSQVPAFGGFISERAMVDVASTSGMKNLLLRAISAETMQQTEQFKIGVD